MASETINNPSYELHGSTPDPTQTWLLQAALSKGDQAIAAWRSWRDHIDLDTVDAASFRLLPLAYRSMMSLGQDGGLVMQLKGIYRHSWCKNQVQYQQSQEVLASFNKAGLPTIVLKGAALSERFYQDDGIPFMNGVDLMVRESDFERAAGLLLELGWKPEPYSYHTMLDYHRRGFKHGCCFKKGNVALDLHCQLIRFVRGTEQAIWLSSIEGSWQGSPVHYLNDTYQFFHTCVDGVRWSYDYLSWVPDALTILRCRAQEIDWDILLGLAQDTRMIPYLRNALAYLVSAFQAPIPDDVMRKLGDLPVSWVEKREYHTLAQKPSNNLAYKAGRVLYQSCRYRASTRVDQQPIKLSPTAWVGFLAIHLNLSGRPPLLPRA